MQLAIATSIAFAYVEAQISLALLECTTLIELSPEIWRSAMEVDAERRCQDGIRPNIVFAAQTDSNLAKQISRAGFERRLRHSPTGKVEAQMYLDLIQQT